ncbi:MAG: hypothetical protein B7Y02_02030 [Rhodobacterales bacterium 17-64-5]|nr:MAG: hypothetical protein B7Y02_02030 [Rhodobacterales bacterium 17-64-5]
MEVKYEWRYPSGPNGESLPSYLVAVDCRVDGKADAVALALADLRKFQTPAPIRMIEGWLAVLSVIVARRKDDEFAEELRIEAYASRLAGYPADVVHEVLLVRTYMFWPTWDELKKICDSLASPRRFMIHALERLPAKPEPKRRPPTTEERTNVQAMVDQMFPMRSKEMRVAAVEEALKGNCMIDEPEETRHE